MLHNIRNAGHGQVRQTEADAQQRETQMLENARREAEAQRRRILADGQANLSRQQALIQQQALMRALQIHADARQSLVESALKSAQQEFSTLRTRKDYPHIFNDLAQEALTAIQPSLLDGQHILLHIDPRDSGLAKKLLKDMTDPPQVVADLDCSGGCTAETEDQLVMVKNTINSRFEHALPFIRQELAIFFEDRTSAG